MEATINISCKKQNANVRDQGFLHLYKMGDFPPEVQENS